MRKILSVKVDKLFNNNHERLIAYRIKYSNKGCDYLLDMAENLDTKQLIMISDINPNIYIVTNRKYYTSLLELAKASL